MATYPISQVFAVYERSGVVVMARIVGEDAALVTQATFTTIAYSVVDVDRNKESQGSGAVTIADAVYDTAQTGNAWPFSDGFNFRFVLPASCFPRGGHFYRGEFTFTPAAGQVFHAVVDLDAKDLYSK